MTEAATDYETPGKTAIYTTSEWGDFLTPPDSELAKWIAERFGFNPTVSFYRKVRDLASAHLKAGSHVLEVGSATGRFLYELATSGIPFGSLTGCEISKQFSEYASCILLGKSQRPVFPMLGDSSYAIEDRAIPQAFFDTIQADCKKANITIVNSSVDDFVQKGASFDAVFCLNVVDRHPSPRALVDYLSRLVKPGGILCVACSFDWVRSPAQQEEFCDHLNVLFEPTHWAVLEDTDMDYTVIGGARQGYVYRTQVVVYGRR